MEARKNKEFHSLLISRHMLSLFQETSTLVWVELHGKTSSTTMKIPPSSSFPWALIVEHNVMWNGISLWPCISVPVLPHKNLAYLLGKVGTSHSSQVQGSGRHTEEASALGIRHTPGHSLRTGSPWASGWPQLSRARGQTGQGCGAGGQPSYSFTGPSSSSWYPQGLMWSAQVRAVGEALIKQCSWDPDKIFLCG